MGEVRLLKLEELGLTNEIQLFEDGIRTEPRSGSYEWWYFDSKYADGSSLVIIFYTKPVTSFAKNFQPFVSLNYIHPNGKEIRTQVASAEYSFSKDQCDVIFVLVRRISLHGCPLFRKVWSTEPWH